MEGIVWDGHEVRHTAALTVRGPEPDEVVVEVRAAGVCNSDLGCVNGRFAVPHPIVLGHEGAGVVVSTGAAVSTVRPGDHVVLTTLGQCGRCRACETGRPTLCARTLGGSSQPFLWKGEPAYSFANVSAFAEQVVVGESQAVAIDPGVPLDVACIVGCAVLTGAGAVWNTAQVRPGELVAVIGLGGVGLAAVQAAQVAGASAILGVDFNPGKAEIAAVCGATSFVAVAGEDAANAIRDGFGDGADVVIACVGNVAAIEAGIASLAWGGRCILVASPPAGECVSIDVDSLIYVDRSVKGSRYGSSRPHADIPYVLDLYQQGRFALDEMISDRAPLRDAASMLEALAQGVEGRIVLTVSST